jgi:Protein of unknown function (DUF2637)
MTARADRKTERINPDSMVTLWLTVGLVCFLAVASFMVSFTGLHEVAAWAGLPVWLRWAVPVFIDVAILAYTMAVLIHRHRGERTWASWISLAGFTLFSMIANGAHALSIPHPNEVQQIIGAAVASMAPVAVFAATEQLGRLVIRRPEEAAPMPPGSQNQPALDNKAAGVERPQRPDGQVPLAIEPPHVSAGAGKAPVAVAASVSADGVRARVADTSARDAPEAQVKLRSSAPQPKSESRPQLSVVGAKPAPGDLEGWAIGLIASGSQPTGKSAAEFLGVSERTGRTRLNELKTAKPDLFTGAYLKEGTNS